MNGDKCYDHDRIPIKSEQRGLGRTMRLFDLVLLLLIIAQFAVVFMTQSRLKIHSHPAPPLRDHTHQGLWIQRGDEWWDPSGKMVKISGQYGYAVLTLLNYGDDRPVVSTRTLPKATIPDQAHAASHHSSLDVPAIFGYGEPRTPHHLAGQLYYDGNTGRCYVWDGTVWVDLKNTRGLQGQQDWKDYWTGLDWDARERRDWCKLRDWKVESTNVTPEWSNLQGRAFEYQNINGRAR
jgi:hypothetical protein